IHRTLCKKCGKPQKVTQFEKSQDSLKELGKRRNHRKQSGCGGQTEESFQKKEKKNPKKIVLRLDCVEPSCRSKRKLAMKRFKHFELGGVKKRKGQVIQF
ncbi:large ribosomal subunit protein eL42-like, partial [Macrotis lagotis]|uniref:large ribosomal subunit protein eL42-like n=1 Tax=Macrotis lagotis TaxID=92651 RepID=UPI003D69C70B